MRRPSHRSIRQLSVAVVAGAMLVSATTVAAANGLVTFRDVDPGSAHADAIDWLSDTGVTVGCETDAYCPDEEVSRAQLASFLQRLAKGEIVDAGSLEGQTADELRGRVQATVCPAGEHLTAVDAEGEATCAAPDLGYDRVVESFRSGETGVEENVSVSCPEGKVLTGGGIRVADGVHIERFRNLGPSVTGGEQAYNVRFTTPMTDLRYSVTAICIDR